MTCVVDQKYVQLMSMKSKRDGEQRSSDRDIVFSTYNVSSFLPAYIFGAIEGGYQN